MASRYSKDLVMSVAMLNIFITLSALQDELSLLAFFSQASFTDTSQAAILSCWQRPTRDVSHSGMKTGLSRLRFTAMSGHIIEKII